MDQACQPSNPRKGCPYLLRLSSVCSEDIEQQELVMGFTGLYTILKSFTSVQSSYHFHISNTNVNKYIDGQTLRSNALIVRCHLQSCRCQRKVVQNFVHKITWYVFTTEEPNLITRIADCQYHTSTTSTTLT